jgi:hypothetical protein
LSSPGGLFLLEDFRHHDHEIDAKFFWVAGQSAEARNTALSARFIDNSILM